MQRKTTHSKPEASTTFCLARPMPQVMKEELNRLIDSGAISKYRGYTYFSSEKAR